MKQAIQPYLHFQDNCKEAMQFYRSVFGGELDMMKVSDSPASKEFPKEVQDQILHATLHHGDLYLMGSDMCGQGERKNGNAYNLSLNCGSEEEIRTLYKQLSDGGKIISELKQEFWGDLFAMVSDRFGVRWMLSLAQK